MSVERGLNHMDVDFMQDDEVRRLGEDAQLGAAWRRAEAALPEGWRMDGLFHYGADWSAQAEPKPAYRSTQSGTTWLGIGKHGPTPTLALEALATTLEAMK